MVENMAFILRRQSPPALPLTVVYPKAGCLTSISITGFKNKTEIRTSTISQVTVRMMSDAG